MKQVTFFFALILMIGLSQNSFAQAPGEIEIVTNNQTSKDCKATKKCCKKGVEGKAKAYKMSNGKAGKKQVKNGKKKAKKGVKATKKNAKVGLKDRKENAKRWMKRQKSTMKNKRSDWKKEAQKKS